MKEEKPLITSDNNIGIQILLSIILAFGLGGLSYYLINSTMKDEYLQLPNMVFGSLSGLAAITLILSNFLYFEIAVYKDKILTTTIIGRFKKTIYLDEITSWTETFKKINNTETKKLIIKTNSTQLKISSIYYWNYDELKETILKDKRKFKNNNETTARWNKKLQIYILAILSLICFYGSYNFYLKKNTDLKREDLTYISDEVTSEIKINRGSKGASNSIRIKLKSIPDFTFIIGGNSYSAMRVKRYIANVKTGQILTLGIKTKAYSTKIAKYQTIDFWDKRVDYNKIAVFEATDSDYEYLNLNDYNKVNKSENSIASRLFLLLGITFLTIGIYKHKYNLGHS
jgi:hypothetical protein